ncbi:multiple sugar transport system substrate-binding protein [Kibdelosporangium banguiense]|uniref:Multiple sugar transport system substrate-binding protein n=1 Tax=Kibdelosporangium banguiense TaxID=1365924 RepID=A0ABS4TMD2_9PSEU|nr:ABC transporter substrate-binding protein [Kibdelosporangium banguiense]MBP2325551.1 multiple sugar transport system substrate-binding protein [Kibdelosporangium banguiense]
MADLQRRWWAGLGAAILLVLAGCAPPPPDPFDNRGPIIFVDGHDTSFGKQIEQLVNEWNRRHDYSEKVTFIEMPDATDAHRAQLRAHAQDLAPGDQSEYPSQCYDVVTMDIIWTAEFAKAGYLVPLDRDEFQVDKFLKRPVEAVTLDGRLWAIPMRTDAGLLYYRKDLLDAEHTEPPRTWEQLIRQARTIAPKYGKDGYVGQFNRYEGFTVNAMEAIWAKGGDVLSPQGAVIIQSPQAKAGIKMLASGFEDGWIPRAALTFTEERSREAFQTGSTLFLRNWPYVYQRLSDPKSPVSDKFGVTTLPGPSALGGWNLGVSNCSTHRQTARNFIKFVTDETNQRNLFRTAGFAPAVAALYEDPELRKQFPYLDVLRRSVENSRNRPATPYYGDVSAAIHEYLANALTNPVSTDAMIDSLVEQLTAVTQGR